MKEIKGRAAWVFADDFDVDYIIGIENIRVNDINKIMELLMKPFETDFKEKVKAGDILIGGKNFGYGHPHPQAMMGMRQLGIDTIVAESFAFAFYRSELAAGMKLIVCPGIREIVNRWDEITVDMAKNKVINLTQAKEQVCEEIAEIPMKIMEYGGIVGFLQNRAEHKLL